MELRAGIVTISQIGKLDGKKGERNSQREIRRSHGATDDVDEMTMHAYPTSSLWNHDPCDIFVTRWPSFGDACRHAHVRDRICSGKEVTFYDSRKGCRTSCCSGNRF